MLLQTEDITKLEKKLEEGKGFNFRLNGDGVFHMERKLPFLLVYRPDEKPERDAVIENIIKHEASYMVCPSRHFQDYRHLLEKVVKNMSDEFGAFLLMEIWPHPDAAYIPGQTAGFELLGPSDLLADVITPVKEYIENMNLAGLLPKASLTPSENRCPENMQPLLERKKLKQLECLLLGLKIEPFYMNPETRLQYPLLERRLYSSFSEVFKKAVFDFVTVQTNNEISGFQSLARRRIKPEVWKIDKQLVDIDNQIQFLMLVSPVNGNKAWKEFKKNGFGKWPVFHYRMMPVDPELLKRALYNIKIEDVDDPTLGFLFREKRSEIDKMLTMLNARESTDFFYGSLQLFGSVSKELLTAAEEILESFPVRNIKKKKRSEYYVAEEFAELARQELLRLKEQCPEIQIRTEIKDTINNMMVDKGILYIPANIKVSRKRARALIQHEVGTHVLTYYNGQSQPLKLLSSGIPGYEELQEGIAVLAEYLSGGLGRKRMQVLAARVIAVDSLINHRDFVKTFELLSDKYHFSTKSAFFITTRVYRGGGLTKDAIYLRGLKKLFRYLKEGNRLEPLLIGKIRQNYIPVINELIERKILNPMKLTPSYLQNPESLERLAKIKNMKKITSLMNPVTQ